MQTDYHINDEDRTAEESYEIKIRNHRKDAAQVRVWEHPCRWRQWDITAQSQPFAKVNQQTFEFVVSVAPNEEKKDHLHNSLFEASAATLTNHSHSIVLGGLLEIS